MATKKRGRRAPAKKSRAGLRIRDASELVPPRFIQIAASSRLRSDNEGGIDRLFALDEFGHVWEYDDDKPVWIELGRGRQPNATHEEEG